MVDSTVGMPKTDGRQLVRAFHAAMRTLHSSTQRHFLSQLRQVSRQLHISLTCIPGGRQARPFPAWVKAGSEPKNMGECLHSFLRGYFRSRASG